MEPRAAACVLAAKTDNPFICARGGRARQGRKYTDSTVEYFLLSISSCARSSRPPHANSLLRTNSLPFRARIDAEDTLKIRAQPGECADRRQRTETLLDSATYGDVFCPFSYSYSKAASAGTRAETSLKGEMFNFVSGTNCGERGTAVSRQDTRLRPDPDIARDFPGVAERSTGTTRTHLILNSFMLLHNLEGVYTEKIKAELECLGGEDGEYYPEVFTFVFALDDRRRLIELREEACDSE